MNSKIQKLRKILIPAFLGILLVSFTQQPDDRTRYFPKTVEYPVRVPKKENLWFFILAGQSNMAGRGQVEPQDTLADPRIWSMSPSEEWILAKEPLHHYEPSRTGLDCGLSFAKVMIGELNESITIVLLPAAVGGSAIRHWLGDSLYRGIHLRSNLYEKIDLAKKYGQLKGILWHQGESDAHKELIPGYEENLRTWFGMLRVYANNEALPILAGELGNFPKNIEGVRPINRSLHHLAKSDRFTRIVTTENLNHKGDSLHFNSKAQRILGKRYAEAYLKMIR